MKLSKVQQDVLDKMRNGWELGIDTALYEYYWMQQGGLGKGGKSQNVSKATVRALVNRNLIKPAKMDGNIQIYVPC